jgi:hypothetical protein
MRALEATQKVSNARLVQLIEHEPKADAGLPAEVQTILWSFHRSLAAASASADFERSAPRPGPSRGSTEGTRMEGVRRLFSQEVRSA